MTGDLSPETQAFLHAHVEEYEHLELLLLLFRERERSWTTEEAAERLNLPFAVVAGALTHLRSHTLVEAAPGEKPRYRYRAKQPDVDACVGELAVAYENDRVKIVHRMNANALERLRNSAIRAFSDAFRLRKGQDDG
ncbi:MAG TPA: hypothetical protein VFV75_03790 [Candidatus Polarisedimenticolaceae bacterium]|nr:hypothetical protein [Candidatus Polarisedimenticolaceae bacterium]